MVRWDLLCLVTGVVLGLFSPHVFDVTGSGRLPKTGLQTIEGNLFACAVCCVAELTSVLVCSAFR